MPMSDRDRREYKLNGQLYFSSSKWKLEIGSRALVYTILFWSAAISRRNCEYVMSRNNFVKKGSLCQKTGNSPLVWFEIGKWYHVIVISPVWFNWELHRRILKLTTYLASASRHHNIESRLLSFWARHLWKNGKTCNLDAASKPKFTVFCRAECSVVVEV